MTLKSERIATAEAVRVALAVDPHCWFCGVHLEWKRDPDSGNRKLNWPTYDHRVSRVNPDLGPGARLRMGWVLACMGCNSERGIYSWRLTAFGLRKTSNPGAPLPQGPDRESGHFWEHSSNLERSCGRCGLLSKRFAPDQGWWWRGSRDRSWQLGVPRLCDQELARVSRDWGYTPPAKDHPDRHDWVFGDGGTGAATFRSCTRCGIEGWREWGNVPWAAWRWRGEQSWKSGSPPRCTEARMAADAEPA